jgi:1-deoxy-D-xylulose-5-phosphate synthase
MVICTPSDENETRKLLTTAYLHNGPASVRYPRGTGPNSNINKDLQPVKIGEANIIKEENSKIVILNFGTLLEEAQQVSKDLKATLVDMRFVKPLDEKLLKKLFKKAEVFISIEDGSIMGGAGSAVQEFVSKEDLNIKSILFGIPDRFIEHASREEMLSEAGLDINSIKSRLNKLL